jgi:hypothetical protein
LKTGENKMEINRFLIYISETNGISLFPLRSNQSGVEAYREALTRNGENQYNTTGIYVATAKNILWDVEKLVLDN